MEIKKLKDCNLQEVEAIVQLDKKILLEYGTLFSEEEWEVKNFLFDLPGKFNNSFVLFNDENEPVAYAINSIKNDFYIYTHRFVNTIYKGSNILIEEMLSIGKVFLLQVSKCNQRAIRFYEKNGYHIVDDFTFIKEILPKNYHQIGCKNNSSSIQTKYLMKLNNL